jgi:hypothetical protein
MVGEGMTGERMASDNGAMGKDAARNADALFDSKQHEENDSAQQIEKRRYEALVGNMHRLKELRLAREAHVAQRPRQAANRRERRRAAGA